MKAGTFEGQTNWHWAIQTLVHGVEFLLKCHVAEASFVVQACSSDSYEYQPAILPVSPHA